MTVSTTTSKASYTGNAVTTSFSFPYPFIASSDLKVYVAGVLKTLTTDYTVSGTAPYPSGANVVFLSAPANGASIVITRVRPFTQTLDLVENDPLPAEQVELLLGDHLVMLLQQLNEAQTRSVTIPITDTSGLTQELASATSRALKGIRFDASGNVGLTSGDPNDANTYATAAAASAAAASSSASSASGSASTATTQAAAASLSAAQAAASAAGMKYRSARAGSTANVSVSSAPASLDGITGVSLDRWLLKNQTAPAENGLYQFNGAGSALTRTIDMDTWAEVDGTVVVIEEGTVNADTVYLCTSNAGGTLGTTAITFVDWAATLVNGTVTNAKLANMAAATIKACTAGGAPIDASISTIIDYIGSVARGDILYRNATIWTRLPAGTSGQFLKTLGAGADPAWATPTTPTYASSNSTTGATSGNGSATGVMAGFAGTITPSASGKVLIIINGNASILGGTPNEVGVQLRYGTGAAPGANAALTGTAIGSEIKKKVDGGANGGFSPFEVHYVLTGLGVGTAHWLDLGYRAVAGTTTANLDSCTITAVELP